MAKVTINTNFEGVLKDFDDLKRHVRRNAEFGAEKGLKVSIKKLQANLTDVINNQIRIGQGALKADGSAGDPLPEPLNVPKSKADIIKHIFGEDMTQADFFQKSLGNKTINDNSNVFSVKDKRIKGWQTVNDGSTYEGDEARFKERLAKGIIIDADTGKMFKLDPKTVQGVKLECSRDTGQTLDSDKKYQAYKQSDKMSREKNGSDQRLAVWTVKQADVTNMMAHAVSVDEIVKRVLDEDFDTAKRLLEPLNKDGSLDTSLTKIEELRANSSAVPADVRALTAIQKLIRNLKVEKQRSESNTTRYILFTTVDEAADANVKFMAELQTQVRFWLLTEQEDWFKSIVDQVLEALAQYDSKAKFK